MKTIMADKNIAVGDHRDLLDIIDNLRSQGVSHYVDLPEIIVCGDQSAGKSSVLEAISGMSFPAKDRVCTRFATELVLRRNREVSTKVSIIPGENRFGDEKERLESWQPKANIDNEGLGAVTDEAKDAMDPTDTGKFHEDILRIELTGPEQSHLTMVDLPGLFRSGSKEQSDADVETVRGMVERYMARPRSIILTVVAAKYEYVLQEVTRLAKIADPEGARTIGLITKPDTLDVGSDSETYFARLAQNQEEELRLGWHVLKNRTFEERYVSSEERDTIEREFFSQGLWSSIDPSHCGVAALRERLSVVLKDQIIAQIPGLVQDVEEGIDDCDERLNGLGPVRETQKQQTTYLLRVSEEYTSLVTQAVEGTYTDRFFGTRQQIDKFRTRLRAVVRNRLLEFEEEMRLDGQSQYIVDSESEGNDAREIRDVPRISRSDYIEDVANRLKFSKGRELPGLFNPLIVSDLFVEQCEPWMRITKLLTEDIVEAAEMTIETIVRHIAASGVSEGVLKLVRQGIEKLKVELDAQVDELLASAAQHPITCNPELIQNVQRIQQARYKHAAKKRIQDTFGADRFEQPNSKISLNPIELVNLMEKGFESNMERFGSALAVDYMEAYYKVALSRFIDDVSVLAIEDRLVSKLPTLLRSGDILEMSPEEIHGLAGETQETSLERKRLEAKRGILGTGLQSLKSLCKSRNVINAPRNDQDASNRSEKKSTMSPKEASTVTNSADEGPWAITPVEPFRSPDTASMPLEIDEIPYQAEY